MPGSWLERESGGGERGRREQRAPGATREPGNCAGGAQAGAVGGAGVPQPDPGEANPLAIKTLSTVPLLRDSHLHKKAWWNTKVV